MLSVDQGHLCCGQHPQVTLCTLQREEGQARSSWLTFPTADGDTEAPRSEDPSGVIEPLRMPQGWEIGSIWKIRISPGQKGREGAPVGGAEFTVLQTGPLTPRYTNG